MYFIFNRTTLNLLLCTWQVFYTCTLCDSTGLLKMIVGFLTSCHTQYTSDSSICVFLFNRTTLQVLLHTLQMLCMCTLCESTNINTIIEFVPNSVSGDRFNGFSVSILRSRNIHATSFLKLCIPLSTGIVRLWLFPEFGAELPLDKCNQTII